MTINGRRTGMALAGVGTIVAVVLMASATSVGTRARQADTLGLRPETALRAAMDTETIKGDLRGAIAQYQTIVDTYRSTHRAVAAQALLRMGGAFSKAGDIEGARRSYARVVDEFGDRRDDVRLAMAGLAHSQSGVKTTQVATSGVSRLSPDGRSFLSYSNGQLRLVDLTTKTARQLTAEKEPIPEDWQLWEYAFSPAADRVAYAWYSNKDARTRLRILSTAGTTGATPRTIYDNPEVTEILPFDWSRDGRRIAVLIRRPDRIAQVGWIGPDDGKLTVLRTVDWSSVGGLQFSSDSRWLAFHQPGGTGNEDRADRDVVVMALDTPRILPAAATEADESVIGWTPEGDRLLVLSDRGGSNGIWAVPFRQGAPGTLQEQVRQDVGIIRPNVITPAGVFYYSQLRSRANIHLGAFDVEAARVVSPMQPVQKFVGSNTWPEWSRDGKFFSYVSQRRPGQPHHAAVLVIQHAETGERRELFPGLAYMDSPQWSPDGRHFIARGATSKASGIVRIDVNTGKGTLVVPNEVCSGIPTWAASGSTFFCFDFSAKSVAMKHAIEVDAMTGSVVRRLPSVTGQVLGVSPDGKYLLFWGEGGLDLLPLAGGEPRTLVPIFGGMQFRSVSWTPDSKHVTFNSTIAKGGERAQWLLPIDGGAPRKIDTGSVAVSSFRFNPVTGQVLFSPDNQPEYDTWTMENFLSPPARR